MMHRTNWDDLRFVLAVVETGSVAGAARGLGVNHATVLRRIAAFEAGHGGAVFQRTANGYEVLPHRLPVIEAARDAAASFERVSGLMRGEAAGAQGVRITSTDTICRQVLPDVIAALDGRGVLPPVELCCSNAHRDLGRLEADITVRPAVSLAEDLVGQPAGEAGFAVYAARHAAVPDDAWLGVAGPLAGSAVGSWFAERQPPLRIVAAADSFPVLAELAARGRGRAVLPTMLAEGDTRLLRDDRFARVPGATVWVASHAGLARAERLSRLRALLAEGIGDWLARHDTGARPPATVAR